MTRAPYNFADALQQNQGILSRYQTPGTVATTTYRTPPTFDVPTVVTRPRLPADFPMTAAAPAPVMGAATPDAAPAQNAIQRWQAPSTDRYQARAIGRGMQRSDNPTSQILGREFTRIDGSAPHSPLDKMGSQTVYKPDPVEFAGRPSSASRSYGFQGTAAGTAADIAKGDFKWKEPMSYGALAKKYSFRPPEA